MKNPQIITTLFTLFLSAVLPALEGNYMYNVAPQNSKEISLELLLDDKARERCFDPDEIIQGNSSYESGVIRLSGEDIVRSPKSVLDISEVNLMSNQTVRFFIWIKGDNIKASDYQLEKAPAIKIELFDNNGNQIIRSNNKSKFMIRGTFPWFCYHFDVKFPSYTLNSNQENQKDEKQKNGNNDEIDLLLLSDTSYINSNNHGIYVTLSNFGGGTAYFGGLSYTILKKNTELRREQMVSKSLGSYSKNPAYDDLATHVLFGLDRNLKWNFLDRPHLKSIKSAAGMRKYVRDNHNDWFHLQYGIARLPYIIYCCSEYKQSSSFDAECGHALIEELNKIQDSETGLWKCNGSVNLIASLAIVKGVYSPKGIFHSDAESSAMPWNGAVSDAKLNYPAEIIRTLDKMRINHDEFAWNIQCFMPQKIASQNGISQKAPDLSGTVAAMTIIARAMQQFPQDSKDYREAESILQSAYFYCINNFMLNNGSWRETLTSSRAVEYNPDFLSIFELSRALESRRNPRIENPPVFGNVKIGAEKPTYTFKWNGTGKNLNNIRIYCIAADADAESLKDGDIVAVMNREPGPLRKSDPYVLVKKVLMAAEKRGISPAGSDLPYLACKKLGLPENIIVGQANRMLDVVVPDKFINTENSAAGAVYELSMPVKFYVCGVNNYGEISEILPVIMTDEQPEENPNGENKDGINQDGTAAEPSKQPAA